MSTKFFLYYLKSRATILIILSLCVCRLCQFGIYPSAMLAQTTSVEGYFLINNSGYAGFIFVPLFGFSLIYVTRMLSNVNVIVLYRFRNTLALTYLICSFQLALFYSAVITLSSLPCMIAIYHLSSIPSFASFYCLSLFSQTAFFAACSMLFFVLFTITRFVSLPYIMVLLYGVWDFMASNVVGGGVSFIGWGRTFISLPLNVLELLSSVSIFLSIICAMLALVLITIKQSDFLFKRKA